MSLTSALYRHSTVGFAALLLFAVVAFWPRYLAQPFGKNIRFHVHALAMGTWCLLLVAQPFLIRVGNRAVHRQLGRLSYLVAPAVPLSILILNHYRTQGSELDVFRMFLFSSNIGDAFLFTIAYVLAMKARRSSPIHARYMVCTGIAFIPAIFDRIFTFYLLSPASLDMLPKLGQTPMTILPSYAMVGLILAGLTGWDWLSGKGVHAFAWMLGAFGVVYVAPFVLIELPFGKSFLEWYLSMPLS